MPIGIDPKVDFAFKMVFGNPEHPAVTIHFLNAVLCFEQPITEVEILNPIQGREQLDDKLTILDILATDAEGRRYNIEMQTTLPRGLTQRLTYYNCLNYIKQLKSGRNYESLLPAISICVLDQVRFAEFARYHSSFQLRCDQQTDLQFNPDLVFHLLELPKYEPADNNRESWGPLEKWLFFLKHAAQFEAEDLASQFADDTFREAAGVLDMISESPEDRDIYEARLIFAEWDRNALKRELREEVRQEVREEVSQEVREEVSQEVREEVSQEMREEGRRSSLVDMILVLQDIVGDEIAQKDELAKQSSDELSAILDDLQQRLRLRGE